MAAHPIVVVDDELLQRLPERFRTDPRFQKGARLELVPVGSQKPSAAAGWKAFRELRGVFNNEPGDANASLAAERERELEQESR